MADMMYGTAAPVIAGGGDISEDNTNEYYGASYGGPAGMNNNIQRSRYPGLYVGNLTWWTTDLDVQNAINSAGVDDVQEIKFFENRNNGQSKGFCVVTFSSENSLPIVLEKLPKIELHGQNPVVTPYNRHNLNLFEAQTKPRPQVNSNNGPIPQHATGIMGINSISGVHAQAAAMAASSMAYPGVHGYNQQGVGGMGGVPRSPGYHANMRMPMRNPRPMMRGSMPGSMNNGPIMPGGPHQMNRMPRFMQPWNNSQVNYNQGGARIMDERQSRLDDRSIRHDDRSMRDERSSMHHDERSERSSMHHDDRPERLSMHHDDRPDRSSMHHDDRPERSSMHRDDRPERSSKHHDDRLERSSKHHDDRAERLSKHHDDRSERSSRRVDERSSRGGREEERGSRRDDRREDRREEKSSRRADEKGHRADESSRKSRRSRSRSKDKDRKDKRDRRERY